MRNKSIIVALALLLISVMAVGVAAQPIPISVYCILARSSVSTEAMFRFAEMVEERTNNKVKFDCYHSGELGGDVETIEAMRLGTIDMRMAGVGLHSHFYPQSMLLELPFLFKDRAHVQRFIYSDEGRKFMDGFEQYGVKCLTIYDIGFRNISNSRRPINHVDDVRGIKIRVPEIDTYVKVWEKFGAAPVAMAWPDVYMALKTGVLDAQDNAPEHTYTNKTHETQKYYSVINYIWMGGAFTMNLNKWNSLPKDVQEVMLQAAREVSEWTFAELAAKDEWALEQMEKEGLEINRSPDIESFRAKVADLYDELAKESWYDPEVIAAIRALEN
ncbi:MAG: TRAP transporter substrate-binding protein [Limnochordia bacterium]|mgnify:FL=1|jgi:tripartite ATP-independent transporter DctP family solute receptor